MNGAALALAFALATSGCRNDGPVGAAGPYVPPFEANLLLISIDTLRADHLSAYGYARPTSPHIDALAADGHRFEAAYSAIPSTLPSHAALLTSLFPSSLGVYDNGERLAPEAVTLAERLAAAGFATAAFVSETPLDPSTGIDQGFALFEGPDERAAARAARWLGEVGDRRFFCFVHLFHPHTSYLVHPELPEPFALPPGMYPGERGRLKGLERFSPEHVRRTITAYDGEIRFADREVGALLAALDRTRLRSRTLVAFVSDHGETLDEMLESSAYGFDHGEFLSGRELREPLVLWLPPAFPGREPRVYGETVSTLDLMPTILELLGLSCPTHCEGRSLVPLLLSETLPERGAISERKRSSRGRRPDAARELSIVRGRWQLITSNFRPDALYDRAADPGETRNVIDAHPSVAADLRAALREWSDAHETPLWTPPPPLPIPPAVRRSLESLGYLEPSE